MNLRATTGSVAETRAVASRLAGLAEPGDVILLAGDLGAGKTAFTQGFGAGLGVEEPVTSPTFVLARQYDGTLPVHHIDVYRLERMHELFDVGLPEVLDEGGVVLVEWGDAVSPALPSDYLEVRLHFGHGDDDRVLELRPVGPRWQDRWDEVGRLLEPWSAGVGGGAAC